MDVVELSEGTGAKSILRSLKKSLSLAHRLELAVKDLFKEEAGCNFSQNCLSLYNQSENTRLLQEGATDLNMQILKIDQIVTVSWVASSF